MGLFDKILPSEPTGVDQDTHRAFSDDDPTTYSVVYRYEHLGKGYSYPHVFHYTIRNSDGKTVVNERYTSDIKEDAFGGVKIAAKNALAKHIKAVQIPDTFSETLTVDSKGNVKSP